MGPPSIASLDFPQGLPYSDAERPYKRVYKVCAKANQAEIQVDAITGQVLNVSTRPSALLEQLHDGSYFGEWMHGGGMPAVAVGNVILVVTGFYLWLGPKFRRRGKAREVIAS